MIACFKLQDEWCCSMAMANSNAASSEAEGEFLT